MLKKILHNIGLTDKETLVYLACLELGASPVSEIAEKAGINRVTTYDILDKLIHKGFVNFFDGAPRAAARGAPCERKARTRSEVKNLAPPVLNRASLSNKQKMRYFSATDPEIISYETARKAEDFRQALPKLKRLYGSANHPHIQYFEGIAGIKALYADSLSSKTEILNYANSREIRDHWPEYDHEYVQERVKRQIFLRGICPDDDYGKRVQSTDHEYYREIRLVPYVQFTFTNEINIYDDKVAISSFQDELIGMIIQSQAIADTQRDIFKMAWEYAAKE